MADLPEGARLALLHWPWGQPTWSAIVAASGKDMSNWPANASPDDDGIICALLDAELIEELDVPALHERRFRLTPAGRLALDAVQGEAGQ